MEAAAEALAVARRRTHHLHVLVPAGIAQDPRDPFLVAHAKDTPAADRRRQEVAARGALVGGAERQPFTREERAFLALEGVALGVILGFHGICIRIGIFACQ